MTQNNMLLSNIALNDVLDSNMGPKDVLDTIQRKGVVGPDIAFTPY